MAKPFDQLTKGWPRERLVRVEARARELIAEEMTLRDLRKARALTQVKLAKKLGIGQEHVSRLEQKGDMLLSTLAGYVRAMGGDLRLTAEFPDRPPVSLTNLSDISNRKAPKSEAKRRRKAGAKSVWSIRKRAG
jgi:transcriptional regulator with XRE-family HTH domain